MKNQALYTKYRPKVFNDIINQEIVIDFLQKSIVNKKVNHFYIFSGNKGTGKTSTARIFSKTLNCLEKSNNPCNKCNNCLSNINVIEIDAASNNGVDNIRSLIEKSHQVNLSGEYKVFIIDEAHMLSKSAFNAMLKTLEESSSGNVFILATTELDKIPDTIISRAINLYFNNINITHIENLISDVSKKEGFTIDNLSNAIIAKSSNNAARNALINLQKAAIYCDNNIDYESCSKLFQIVDFNTIRNIYENIVKFEKEDMVEKLSFIQNNFSFFLEQLIDYTIGQKNLDLYNYLLRLYDIYLVNKNSNLILKMLFNYNKTTNLQTSNVLKQETNVETKIEVKIPVVKEKEVIVNKISIFEILAEATKDDRILWSKRWLQNSKLIKQKEFMNIILLLLDSKIVAASKKGVIICVEKTYAFEKLNNNLVVVNKLLKYYCGYDMCSHVLTNQNWLIQRQSYLDNKQQKNKKSVASVFGTDLIEEI